APTGERFFQSAEGMNAYLREVSAYANGLGPALKLVLQNHTLVDTAHTVGLEVHPWTLRREELPEGITSFKELHRILAQSGIDGVFSDFPGESVTLFSVSS
ncbi:MAG TPA: glycerophosphodiester phosphodiesterase family protein, partial [Planctomicrobium sp.]|nr:glycerophosphodiester phosphodiesterase family protein [Planctomicrobium sp.]